MVQRASLVNIFKNTKAKRFREIDTRASSSLRNVTESILSKYFLKIQKQKDLEKLIQEHLQA